MRVWHHGSCLSFPTLASEQNNSDEVGIYDVGNVVLVSQYVIYSLKNRMWRRADRDVLFVTGSPASLLQCAARVYSASGGTGGIINNANKAIKTNMIFLKVGLEAERNFSISKRAKSCELLLHV